MGVEEDDRRHPPILPTATDDPRTVRLQSPHGPSQSLRCSVPGHHRAPGAQGGFHEHSRHRRTRSPGGGRPRHRPTSPDRPSRACRGAPRAPGDRPDVGEQLQPRRTAAGWLPVLHLVPVPVGVPHLGAHLHGLPHRARRPAAPADGRPRPGYRVGLRRDGRHQGGAGMNNINGVALAVLIVLFAAVTVMGFWASRWRRPTSMESLDEWGLGGRSFGTWITWFLLGGDLYTAYTFIAVPAAMWAAGSVSGFF